MIIGLLLSFMMGPSFFMLLETSIRKGIRGGLAFDAGVIFSDLIYIIIAYIFIKEISFLTNDENIALLKVIGGGVFVVFGVILFFKQIKESKIGFDFGNDFEMKDYGVLFIKGLVVNFANPLVLFYWFSVLTAGKTVHIENSSGWELIFYIAAILGTLLCVDFIKIVGAKKLRPFITNVVLKSLNRLTGLVLFVFGVFLVINGILVWVKEIYI